MPKQTLRERIQELEDSEEQLAADLDDALDKLEKERDAAKIISEWIREFGGRDIGRREWDRLAEMMGQYPPWRDRYQDHHFRFNYDRYTPYVPSVSQKSLGQLISGV